MLSSPGPGKDGRTCRTARDVEITSSPAAFSLGRQRNQDQEHKAACQLPPAGDCSFFHPATASRMGCSWQLARISSLGRSPCGGIVVQPKASGFLLDSLGSGQHLGLSLSRHRCFFFFGPQVAKCHVYGNPQRRNVRNRCCFALSVATTCRNI